MSRIEELKALARVCHRTGTRGTREAFAMAAIEAIPALLEIAERAKEYVADSNARRDNYRRLAYCTELAAALAKLEATDAK